MENQAEKEEQPRRERREGCRGRGKGASIGEGKDGEIRRKDGVGGEVRREKGKREEGGGAAVCCDAWRKQGPDRINA